MEKHSEPARDGDGFQNQDHASSETRELAEILRKLGEFLQGDAPVDWQEDRQRCADLLRRLAAGCEKSLSLSGRLRGAVTETGGSEHLIIRLEAEPARVFKTTFGDNLGCRSDFHSLDLEWTGRHFHATGNADPFFYLRRWVHLNSISDYQTRYEGVLAPERKGHLPRICVSQPFIERTRDPSEPEIEQALRPYGYRKISADAFLNDENGILLTDAAPRNVGIEGGVPTPFDAIAEIAPRRVLEWAGR